MDFELGDRVIYPHHGAAQITAREQRNEFGEVREYLVLKTAHGELTVKVPTDMADEVGMRPPIDTDDVEDLFELLAKKDVREPANWSRRFKNHQEKLKSGDIYQVAEVVRNLALRESAKGLSVRTFHQHGRHRGRSSRAGGTAARRLSADEGAAGIRARSCAARKAPQRRLPESGCPACRASHGPR